MTEFYARGYFVFTPGTIEGFPEFSVLSKARSLPNEFHVAVLIRISTLDFITSVEFLKQVSICQR